MNPCKHFIGYRHDNPCALGHHQQEWRALRIPTHPCLGECPAPNPCPHFACFTEDELAQHEAYFDKAFQNATAARAAIVAHLSATQAPRDTSGSIPCPVCTTTPPGTLRFSRYGPKGHMQIACTARGCVRYME